MIGGKEICFFCSLCLKECKNELMLAAQLKPSTSWEEFTCLSIGLIGSTFKICVFVSVTISRTSSCLQMKGLKLF